MELRIKIENDIAVLTRAGRPCICPYQTRLITAGAMAGTASINNGVCSSLCPLFSATVRPEQPTGDEYKVELCGGKTYLIVPSESIEKAPSKLQIFPKLE